MRTSNMHNIIKDVTKTDSGGKSYCEHLIEMNDTKDFVGPATIYISHAWMYDFAEFRSALVARFEKEPKVFLWIDIFSNNHHNELTSDKMFTEFDEHIKRVNRTVMIAMPWDNPIPFTRYVYLLVSYYCLRSILFHAPGRGVCWMYSIVRSIKSLLKFT